MNQTTWIVGGGVAIIALAALLYSFTGNDAAPQVIEIDDQVKAVLEATSTAQIKNNTLSPLFFKQKTAYEITV